MVKDFHHQSWFSVVLLHSIPRFLRDILLDPPLILLFLPSGTGFNPPSTPMLLLCPSIYFSASILST